MSLKTQAIQYINDYLPRTSAEDKPSPWKNINRSMLADGLKARIEDPTLVSSSGVNLCGPAAFFHNLAHDNPLMFAKCGVDLYRSNLANIGDRTFNAGQDLLNSTPPTGVDPADWILLASLRDHQNVYLDYESGEGTLSGLSMPGALEKWFRQAGYENVRNEANIFFHKSDTDLSRASGLVDEGHRVCLLIDVAMLSNRRLNNFSPYPDHWVVLKKTLQGSAVTIDKDKVTLNIHSWGKMMKVPDHGSMKRRDFMRNYYGHISAKPA